jgi:hypothetical protein
MRKAKANWERFSWSQALQTNPPDSAPIDQARPLFKKSKKQKRRYGSRRLLTLDTIESAQEVRRGTRQACREFEGGMWRLRDLRDQIVRTKRVCATLAAEQRSNAKEAVIKELKSKVEVNNTTIDAKGKEIPILIEMRAHV